jgi:Tfp pilus assembly protein PilN
MIKVNLLRNRVQDPGGGSSNADSLPGVDSSRTIRENIVKALVIVIFPAGLMLYEAQNIRSLNEEQSRVQALAAKLQGELSGKQVAADKVKNVEVQAKELEDKLKLLKLLSRLRLRHVKTLDFVQSTIPEKVWLKNINYDSDKAHIEIGHFQFMGFATATEELTDFTRKLDGSAYLSDVIVIKNSEIQAANKNTMRDFLFVADAEKKN